MFSALRQNAALFLAKLAHTLLAHFPTCPSEVTWFGPPPFCFCKHSSLISLHESSPLVLVTVFNGFSSPKFLHIPPTTRLQSPKSHIIRFITASGLLLELFSILIHFLLLWCNTCTGAGLGRRSLFVSQSQMTACHCHLGKSRLWKHEASSHITSLIRWINALRLLFNSLPPFLHNPRLSAPVAFPGHPSGVHPFSTVPSLSSLWNTLVLGLPLQLRLHLYYGYSWPLCKNSSPTMWCKASAALHDLFMPSTPVLWGHSCHVQPLAWNLALPHRVPLGNTSQKILPQWFWTLNNHRWFFNTGLHP